MTASTPSQPPIATDALLQQLKTTLGFERFREGQQEVVRLLLQGHSTLAVFPTGAGKSLCYQFTATQLPHLTLVVSPLLALMKDQLDFLHAHNIPAASLDSTLDYDAYAKVVSQIKNNTLKVLMVSVERFKNERFRVLMEGVPISLMVIDEAHCLSEWGHNFRPDYLKLPRYQEALNIPQVLLLTATATKKVKADMAVKFAIAPESIIQTGFYRSNLQLSVLATDEQNKNDELPRLIKQLMAKPVQIQSAPANDAPAGCGIVYVTLQHTAERVTALLKQAGIHACAYHAGIKHEARSRIQEQFMRGEIPVVVATIAFGMGVDKSDIRFVIHYDLPKSIENYSQEIGRAGRDGLASQCIVLGNLETLNTLENFVYGDTPEQASIEHVLKTIMTEQQNGQWEVQLYGLSQASNIRQLTLKTLLVQLEMQNLLSPLYTYSAEYSVKLLCEPEQIITAFDASRRDFVACLIEHIAFKRSWGVVNFEGIYNAIGANGERKRVVSALDYFKQKGWIELKPSGAIEVFSVAPELLDAALGELPDANPNHLPQTLNGLATALAQHFKQHEQTEIHRLQLLLRFLQAQRCLSHGLAWYFDDHNAPKNCGHCSVCQGHSVTFLSPQAASISSAALKAAANTALQHLRDNAVADPSAGLITRFLIGISLPLFTRSKAKHVEGFGIAKAMRFEAVNNFVNRWLSGDADEPNN